MSSTFLTLFLALLLPQDALLPFGDQWPRLDGDATGEWWKPAPAERGPQKKKGVLLPPRLLVPRNEVLAFALYTHDAGTLKLTAQLYPLKPDEPRTVQVEVLRGGQPLYPYLFGVE